MAQYYTRRKIDGFYGDLNGPFESYDDAMDDHTKVCSRLPSNEWPGHMQTFVDLATIVGDQDAMGRLLRSDPVLRSVFSLGVGAGRSDTDLSKLSYDYWPTYRRPAPINGIDNRMINGIIKPMTPAGRPEVGTPINIRLGDDLLAKVDTWRESGPIKVSRASAIRSMVAAALAELDDDTIGSY